jgi:hypothetical protein
MADGKLFGKLHGTSAAGDCTTYFEMDCHPPSVRKFDTGSVLNDVTISLIVSYVPPEAVST